MAQVERPALLEEYKRGWGVLAGIVAQLGEDTLDLHPSEGGWSPREIIHHLADSELIGAGRLRRLLSEERPPIQGYDQEEFSHKLHYQRPIESSLAVFRAIREANSELLHALGEDDWAREGTHSEIGRYTLDTWLDIYATHLHVHVNQIQSVLSGANMPATES